MARLIVNKHFAEHDKAINGFANQENNQEYALGEIVICNDNDNPSIYIKNNNHESVGIGNVRIVNDDKILSKTDGGKIKTSIEMVWDNDTKQIKLYGNDKNTPISSIDILGDNGVANEIDRVVDINTIKTGIKDVPEGLSPNMNYIEIVTLVGKKYIAYVESEKEVSIVGDKTIIVDKTPEGITISHAKVGEIEPITGNTGSFGTSYYVENIEVSEEGHITGITRTQLPKPNSILEKVKDNEKPQEGEWYVADVLPAGAGLKYKVEYAELPSTKIYGKDDTPAPEEIKSLTRFISDIQVSGDTIQYEKSEVNLSSYYKKNEADDKFVDADELDQKLQNLGLTEDGKLPEIQITINKDEIGEGKYISDIEVGQTDKTHLILKTKDLGLSKYVADDEVVPHDVTLEWGKDNTIASIGGKEIKVTMPEQPDAADGNTRYMLTGSVSDNKFKVVLSEAADGVQDGGSAEIDFSKVIPETNITITDETKGEYITSISKNDSDGSNIIVTRGDVDLSGCLKSGALEGYATQEWVNDEALKGYATQSWVNDEALKGYATQNFVTTQGYLKNADINGKFADKTHSHVSSDITDSIDSSDGITKTETKLPQAKAVYDFVTTQGYLKSGALEGYATQEWVSDEALDGYLKSGALEGYATQNFVTTQGYLKNEALNDYAKKGDIPAITIEDKTEGEFISNIGVNGHTLTITKNNVTLKETPLTIESVGEGDIVTSITSDEDHKIIVNKGNVAFPEVVVTNYNATLVPGEMVKIATINDKNISVQLDPNLTTGDEPVKIKTYRLSSSPSNEKITITLLDESNAECGSVGIDLSKYQTEEDVNNLLSTKEFVTQQWVKDQTYATQNYVTTQGYLKSDDINGKFADKTHNHVSSDITDSIVSSNGITKTETKLPQAKAVYDFVTTQGYLKKGEETEYVLPTADKEVLGGIKVGYQNDNNNRNYAVNIDANGNAFVNVPWEEVKNYLPNNQEVPVSLHYTPNTEKAVYTAGEGKYISGIKYDEKQHIVGINEENLPSEVSKAKSLSVENVGSDTNPVKFVNGKPVAVTNSFLTGITSSDVTDALGYTPLSAETKYNGGAFISVDSNTISAKTGNTAETLAVGNHTHEGVYQPKGEYLTANNTGTLKFESGKFTNETWKVTETKTINIPNKISDLENDSNFLVNDDISITIGTKEGLTGGGQVKNSGTINIGHSKITPSETSDNKTLKHGETFNVVVPSVNEYGHVSSLSTTTYTLPPTTTLDEIGAAPKTHNHSKADITDFDHSHIKADITDFEHSHIKADITDFEHKHGKSDITDFEHTHTKSDITDFAHSHTKSEITDFAHSHTKSEITDFAHSHTKAEITDFAHSHTKAEITDFAHRHGVNEIDGVDDKIASYLAANDAMIFKGVINESANLPTKSEIGWTFKANTTNPIFGEKVEIGDLIICIADNEGTELTTENFSDFWTIVQTNTDGIVVGPSSSVAGNIAVFDGTSGKLIKDSGLTIKTSVPENALFTDTNNYLTGVSGDANTTVTFTREGLDPITWDASHEHEIYSLTGHTHGEFTGATSSANGSAGFVKAPIKGQENLFLKGDGTWDIPTNTVCTAGAYPSDDKLYLIGAPGQTDNQLAGIVTNSNSDVYMQEGALYANHLQTNSIRMPGLDSFYIGDEDHPTLLDVVNMMGNCTGVNNNTEAKLYLVGSTVQDGANVTNTCEGVFMEAGKLYANGSEVGTMETINSTVSALTASNVNLDSRITALENSGGISIAVGTDKTYLMGASSTTATTLNIQTGSTSSENGVWMNEGTITATKGFYQVSDEREKNFTNELDIDFDKLKTIPKSYFTWKGDEDKKLEIGTSAQKLKEVYPELVSYDSVDDRYTVSYDKLSIVALKAVDKLHEENEMLRAELDMIKKHLGL